MSNPLIYLIAGEPSGDALGAGLMRALKVQSPGVRFAGIGGEAMREEGLVSLFPYRDLSLMGFLEVVPHIPLLLKRLRETAQDIARRKPDAVVTIDSPGFNFRLASALRVGKVTHSIPRIHYVAPSVWAYKPGRARKTAELFDALLVLLPFEPPYFEKEGLKTTWVGHPVLWDTPKGDGVAFRARHGLLAETPVLLVLPGSRNSEVKHHLPLFLQAAAEFPQYKTVILAGVQVRKAIEQSLHPSQKEIIVADIAEKYDAFAAATMALSKSGTITLELAAACVPTVVAYKVSPLSAWLMRRMILIPYVSLINIAAKKEIMPELLQERCTVENMVQALSALVAEPARQKQRGDYADALAILRGAPPQNPHEVAAQEVLRVLA